MALVLVASAVAACSPDGSDMRVAEVRPFHSTHTAVPVDPSDVVCPSGTAPGRTVLSGQGDPIGAYTGVATSCSRVSSSVSEELESASFNLIAADGDEIWFVLDGSRGGEVIVGQGQTGNDSTVSLGAGFRIIGGTGRFASAKGSVTMAAVGGFGDTAFQATLDGVVAAPGLAR